MPAPPREWDRTMVLPVIRTGTQHRSTSYYRPELDGLRAVAVLLVAAYHIWLGRISGGVDVFLLLTGFFITASLFRMAETRGRVNLGVYFGRLATRLIPTAGTVLLASALLTMAVVPAARWQATVEEIIASAFYYQNWKLAFTNTDYLTQDQPASIVQHFWSISIQGQFYVAWALLFIVTLWITSRFREHFKAVAFIFFFAIFIVSLTYSVYSTAENNVWAYFDTGARMWEFALGALLAIWLPHIVLSRQVRLTIGWVGLVALAVCGLFADPNLFPGYIALWPTAAAFMIIVAGTSGSAFGVDRFLTWRPIKYLGSLAYGIFLWHWPLFISYRELSGEETAGLLDGAGIVLLSIILAFFTKKLLEDGLRSFIPRDRRSQAKWGLTLSLSFLIPVLAVSVTWVSAINNDPPPTTTLQDPMNSDVDPRYPGGMALADPRFAEDLPNVQMQPTVTQAVEDNASVYEDGCHLMQEGTEARNCDYGDVDADTTIVIVGASRTVHWLPALEGIGAENNWKIKSISKSACVLDTDTPTQSGRVYDDCIEWRENVIDYLVDLQPDLVVTSSTRVREGDEEVPEGYISRFNTLTESGIPILGIRDLPRTGESLVDCVSESDAADCTIDVSDFYPVDDPAQSDDRFSDLVTLTDFSPYVCPDQTCHAVVGNVLTYRDSMHLTATYAGTLAPVMEEEVQAVLDMIETQD